MKAVFKMGFFFLQNRFSSNPRNPTEFRAYLAEESRLLSVFKEAALAEVGLTGHEKADKAFDMAWEREHSNGQDSVRLYLGQLADLLL